MIVASNGGPSAVLGRQGLRMSVPGGASAPNPILSVSIAAVGWQQDTAISGLSSGGSYNFGLGTDNNPLTGTPKVVITATSMGFDNTGTPTTVQRLIYGMPGLTTNALREPYPNQLVSQEPTGGGNVTPRIALSDYLYAKDKAGAGNSGTAPNANILGGFYTASAVPNSAGSGITVTNNSTVAYPKVIGHFVTEQNRPVNGTEVIEVFVVHKYGTNGKPVARVVITATGVDSGHTETGSATSMTLSARGDLIPVYAVSLNLSIGAGFTRGEVVNVNFVAYPWIGDSAACLNSATDAGTQIFQLGPLQRTIMDKVYAVVDGIGSVTPTASTSQATADANPFATNALAGAGIMATNLSAFGLNRVDGGEIQCKAGTYTYISSGTATNGYVTITHHSSTNRAGVVFQESSPANQTKYLRFYDVTITRTANTYLIFAANSNVLVMEAVNFNDTHTAWYSGDTNTNVEFLDCISNNGYFCRGTNDGHSRLIRNYTYTATTETTGAPPCGNASCVLGFKGQGGANGAWITLASAGSTNFIFAYSTYYALTDGQIFTPTQDMSNWAILNNVFERISAASTPLIEISSFNFSNLLTAHNTFTGQRFNHENDWVTPSNKVFTDYVGKFNAFNARGNHRADIRATDPTLIGTWSVDNSVGWESNHDEAISFTGDQDCWGVNANFTAAQTSIAPPVPAGYVNDASEGGTNLGNGDYHPASGSVLLGKITGSRFILPFDIDGNTRASIEAAGAYIGPPTNVTAPVITSNANLASPHVGDILTTDNGVFVGSTSSSITWWQNASPSPIKIAGATASTYTIQAGDLTVGIFSKIKANNAVGHTLVNSNISGVVS